VVRLCGPAIAATLVLVAAATGQKAQPVVPPPNPPPASQEVRIGFPEALFKDVAKPLINAAVGPFQKMIQREIGMHGTMKICQDYADLADDLRTGKVDIAVFHGFEYAWVKHNADLVPLVITKPSCGKVQACLVVHANCKAKKPQDLKGACIGLPKGSKAHCTMYLKFLHDNIGNVQKANSDEHFWESYQGISQGDVSKSAAQGSTVDELKEWRRTNTDAYRSAKEDLEERQSFHNTLVRSAETLLCPPLAIYTTAKDLYYQYEDLKAMGIL